MDLLLRSGWSDYRPSFIHGFPGQAFELGIAHAATGGQDSATGTEPIPPANAGTTSLQTVAGVPYTGAVSAQFDEILTAYINRQIIKNLRDDLLVLQSGGFLRANHVPGTKTFRYTMFADLGPADTLLEGVPPQTAPLTWDTFEFTGSQRGKLVAITDLAELFSSYDLYSVAAEKLAWNAIDTAEIEATSLLTNNAGIPITGYGVGAGLTIENNIVSVVTALKKADVPMFPDGYYHALISPGDAAKIMTATNAAGWTETMKYANSQALLNGEIGRFRGLRFIESNRITDGKSIIMGPGAVIWGDYQTIQTYRTPAGGDHADPLAQRALLGWKGMWGLKLNEFDGTVAAGPASNLKAQRWTTKDLTDVTA